MIQTIIAEMFLGNFSFAILVFAIAQLIVMIMNYRPKPKLLNIDKILIDPQKVIDIKTFMPDTDPFNNAGYVQIKLQDEEVPILVYGNQKMKKVINKYKKVYKKIYRRKIN